MRPSVFVRFCYSAACFYRNNSKALSDYTKKGAKKSRQHKPGIETILYKI